MDEQPASEPHAPDHQEKINLLVIGPLPPPYGGVANFVHNSIKQESLRSRCEVKVLRTGKRNRSTPEAVQAIKEFGQFIWFLMRRGYRDEDVVHIHTSSYWGFTRNMAYIFSTRRFSDAALIIHIHGGKFKEFFAETRMPGLVRSALTSADSIIVTSPSWIKVMEEICGEGTRILALPNGFDSAVFRPLDKSTARKRLRLPSGKKILVTVGYLEEVKGHRFLIEAVREVVDHGEDVAVYIIGSGSLKDKLSSLAEDLGIAERVFFVEDGKPPEEISLWMNSADLFVLPSLHEGSPTVMFECLGCGKPMVGTKVGGVPDIIASDKVGLLCDPSDSAALASCLISALGKTWDEGYIAEYAKQFTWENIASQLADIYLSTLQKR